MPRIVKCVKLGQELPGMVYKPFNNELGQRIYDSVSQEAWMMWIEFSKRIVNELRLDLATETGQKLLLEQAEEFFFGAGGKEPPEYVP
jgi:Fe-S cluster biosynthesis and repair protein YggX